MARLIVWNLVTLDGAFEGQNPWDLDWHPWSDDLERLSLEQLDQAGGLLFGRKTYEGMAAYWSTATGAIADRMNALPKAVASRSWSEAGWTNSRVLPQPVEASVKSWKAAMPQDLYVFGSADLVDQLWAAGLVDEFRLGVVPLVLGKGTPLFKPHPTPRPLHWVETKTYAQGLLVSRYRPLNVDPS